MGSDPARPPDEAPRLDSESIVTAAQQDQACDDVLPLDGEPMRYWPL